MTKSRTHAPAQARVRFDINHMDALLVKDCVVRAMAICARLGIPASATHRMDLHMDLTATHANGNPMDFARLLGFDDTSFMHDISGITSHLDRDTGKLRNCFRPRASKQEA